MTSLCNLVSSESDSLSRLGLFIGARQSSFSIEIYVHVDCIYGYLAEILATHTRIGCHNKTAREATNLAKPSLLHLFLWTN